MIVGRGPEGHAEPVLPPLEHRPAGQRTACLDVVRVRMFVTDIKDAEAVTAAFTKAVGHARPTGTLVAVAALAGPNFKVEIEAEAVVGSGQ